MAEPSGVDAALKEANFTPGEATRAALDAQGDAQFALELGENVVEAAYAHRGVKHEPRRGRPRGSRNKRTRDLVEFLHAQGHKDPLVAASEIVTAGVDGVAIMLGVPLRDAFAPWLACVQFVTKYTHQAPPVAIDTQGAPLVPIHISVTEAPQNNQGNSSVYVAPPVIVAQSDSRTEALSD